MGHLSVDMSRWGGDLTAPEASCLKEAGVQTVVLATGPGGYDDALLSQIDDAVANGLTIEVYYFVEWGNNPAAWVDAGATALGDYKKYVKRVWIDVEDTTNPPPNTISGRESYVRMAVDRAKLVYGVEVGIYTGGWYWKDPVRGMANSSAFSNLPLWNSWYDNDPDIDGLPYGGWTRDSVAIEQYTGTVIICGQSVDTNWVYKPMEEATKPKTEVEILNEAVMQRFDIIKVGSGEYTNMQKAWQLLKNNGLLV